ncbi:MAG: RrF2 family transcriptional regulator [Phycisphaerae bacterium]
MNLSQKCQYALRGLFELARRGSEQPVPIGEISRAQAIPGRFLELIFAELKQAGYVRSRRGVRGGYMLAKDPEDVTVGEIIRFVDGPLNPVKCLGSGGRKECPLYGDCAFIGLWQRATQAVADVYDSTTLQELVNESRADAAAVNYCI